MLESVMKTVLMGFGDDDCKEDLPKLLKKVQKNLKLDPSEIHDSVKGAEIVRRVLSKSLQAYTNCEISMALVMVKFDTLGYHLGTRD